MARNDPFKRYEAVGAEVLASARTWAAELLRELSDLGETTQRQAQGQVEDLIGSGKSRSNALVDVVRAEIRAQLAQLGLATKADLRALEDRLGASTAPAAPGVDEAPAKSDASAKKAGPAKTAGSPKSAASAKKAASPKKATSPKSAASPKSAVGKGPVAKKVPSAKKTAAAKAAGGEAAPRESSPQDAN